MADCLGERLILGGVGAGSTEDDVEHDRPGAGLGEAFEEGRVEAAIPGFGRVLLSRR